MTAFSFGPAKPNRKLKVTQFLIQDRDKLRGAALTHEVRSVSLGQTSAFLLLSLKTAVLTTGQTLERSHKAPIHNISMKQNAFISIKFADPNNYLTYLHIKKIIRLIRIIK